MKVVNPKGPNTDSRRVFRGGGWGINADFLVVSRRVNFSPGRRVNVLGFRLVCNGRKK